MDSGEANASFFNDSTSFVDNSIIYGHKPRKVRPVIDSDSESSEDDFMEDSLTDDEFKNASENKIVEESGEEDLNDSFVPLSSTLNPAKCEDHTDDESGDEAVLVPDEISDEEVEDSLLGDAAGFLDNSTYSSEDVVAAASIINKENLEIVDQERRTDSIEDMTPEILEDSLDIVEVSSDEEETAPRVAKILTQPTLKSFINKTDTAGASAKPLAQVQVKTETNYVTQTQYQEQARKVNQMKCDLLKTKNAMRVIKFDSLPDRGESLFNKQRELMKRVEEETNIMEKMVVEAKAPINAANKIQIAWEQVTAAVDAVAPRALGKKGVAQFQAERNLAVETLDELHKSLDTCPGENDFAEDPKGLIIPLMIHQQRALAWLLWREKQKPSGGLLADDMGLGKTLTMISLIIKSLDLEQDDDEGKENYRDKYPGGTLVVCPASLINQWETEIARRTKRGLLDVEVYHGAKRETKAKRLARHDVVITTYALVSIEREKTGPIFSVRWRRIILDEAHQIRNHKCRTAEANCALSAKSRWCLTGTPVHNKELDMYSLLKFLRCSPFDNLQVWKHWVSDKSTGGQLRLHAVVSSLMLRRTKVELMEKGILKSMPERKWELIKIQLDKDETGVYQKILIFSRTLFAQFLHQRAEKNQDFYDTKVTRMPADPNGEYAKMRNRLLKINKVKEVNQHDILVLLLRLRQICCHPSLITQMLEGNEDLGNAEDEEESDEMNLLEQLNKMDLNDDDDGYNPQGLSSEPVNLKEASKGYLNPNNPVFAKERSSSKIKVLVDLLKEKVASGDKAIIVSQWTGLLKLVAIHVKSARIICDSLDGTIPVNKRMPIVDNFNNPHSDTKVLLLSLTAGGVGLNLVGANHLFLLDLHWNPQLENQAQDRIYRMGQTKNIFVYKFMAADTIEERIKLLQDSKLEIAEGMLTGSKKITSSKLTLNDLKLIFDFK